MKAKRSWRFVTLTLPGSWYPVRTAKVGEQLQTLRRAFASWRLKMKRLGHNMSGFYTIEFEGDAENNWHTHVHMLMKWNKRHDYNQLKEMWTESVDRPMRKQLASWTDGAFTNDQRVVQVDEITSQGIADYCTKVTNYVTKGPKSDSSKTDIAKTLYRRRTTGWMGDYYGGYKKGKLEEESFEEQGG